MFAHIPLVVK